MSRRLICLALFFCTALVGHAQEKPRLDRHGDPLPLGAVGRLGTVRFRHGNQIVALAYSADGKLLASGGMDAAVCLWDAATGKRLHRLTGHQTHFGRIAFAPDGKTLASVSTDHKIIVWDVATGKQRFEREGATFVFTPDGRLLTGGRNGGGMSPNFDAISVSTGPIRCWQVATGKELSRPAGWGQGWPLAVSPDGKHLACLWGEGNNPGADARKPPAIHFWDLATGKKTARFPVMYGTVRAAVFSGDRLTVASADHLGISLWVAGDRRDPRKLAVTDFLGLTFAPGGKRLAVVGGAGVQVFDTASGRELRRLRAVQYRAMAAAFAPDGKTLAAGGEATALQLWEVATGAQLPPAEGHQGWVDSVALSPDRKTVVSASADDTVRIWDWATGRQVRLLPMPHASCPLMALSPDGKILAATGSRHLWLWDAATGKELRQLTVPKFVDCLMFSPDGDQLATINTDASLRVWRVSTGKELWQASSGTPDRIHRLAFAPDGRTLAVAARDMGIHLWDAAGRHPPRHLAGQSPLQLAIHHVTAIAFSPDGRALASAHTRKLHLWEVATGGERLKLDLPSKVHAVAYSPDGTLVAAGCHDGVVRLWDVTTGKIRHQFTGHAGHVNDVAFSADGGTLASASSDTTVLLWDVTPFRPRWAVR